MAESAVSEVVSRLAGLLSREITLLYGVRGEVEWMESELRWIKCFLKDADAKRRKGDARVKNWVSEVIQVAYQAEDAIDTFLIKVHPASRGFISWINTFGLGSLKARYYVGVEIGKIKERINQIKVCRDTYGIQNLGEDGDATSSLLPVRRRHFSYQSDDADVVVGHANDQKILREQLMNHDHQKRLCVISIVGIGGLGKTTLARKLYRSNDVSSHFAKRIWVTVSQENSLMGLLRKILQKVAVIEREELEKMGESNLIDKLNESLRTQRFLIVLDDIWVEDVWVQMQRSFPDVNNGSRVLITTRFLNVAKRADPRSIPHELSLLNDSESMKLFLKKAFPHQDDDDADTNCPSGLLDIGHRLMRKCGGLPLALVVLGGLLSIKEKTPVVWLRMLETMDWEAEGRECREILALSYEDLPYHMKSCFLYLGAYPEDSEISGKVLIRQWVAEGFIPQDSERKAMEDTGEAILEELIQRSLIHVNSRKSNGSVKTCGVHDLLLDLARSEAKKDGFLTVFSHEYGFLTVVSHENYQTTPQTLSRRLAIHNINVTAVRFNEIHTMHRLRTLMLFGGNAFLPLEAVSGILRFELLRALDLTGISYLSELPEKIKSLIHLRYLALPHMAVEGVPSSIGNLAFLETVNAETVNMPLTLWKIKTLRHVQVYCCKPPQNHESRNLLTLGLVSFGSHRTINWRLPNLRKLKVRIDEEHHGAMLAHLLNQLDHLISLFITSPSYPIKINTKDFPFHNHLTSLILDGYWPMGDIIAEFPTYLTKLELWRSGLKQDPMPKLERLQYLVTLKLGENVYVGENVYGWKTMVCSAGGFPRLERMSILAMRHFHEWWVEEGAMSKLTFLNLKLCSKLKMLPDLQHVTSLQELKLEYMSEELMLSIRKETGQDWHKIQHVPKLTFEK